MIIRTCPTCAETHILLHHTTNFALVQRWYWQTDEHVRVCAIIKRLERVISAYH